MNETQFYTDFGLRLQMSSRHSPAQYRTDLQLLDHSLEQSKWGFPFDMHSSLSRVKPGHISK